MSLFIDTQYIQQIGSRLEKFKKKSQYLFNFRCPICGDSEKSKIKARGYFYRKGNDMYYSCHNCMRSWTLGHFLRELDQSTYEQYIFERYSKGENGHSNYEKPKFEEFNFKWSTKPGNQNSSILSDYSSIDSLPDDHLAKKYISARQIPVHTWSDLRFVPDFKVLVDKLEPENEYALPSGDQRIVIPFYDRQKKLIALQGRSLGQKGIRYITIKIDKDAPKIYGLDKIDDTKPIYVTEGPFDAMFLDNSLATAGAALTSSYFESFDDVVFIYDNEKRNPSIVKAMTNIANTSKHRVCP